MADEELKTLIVDGRTGILHGFTSRFGKPFEAGLELNDKFRATLYFPAREEDEAAGVEGSRESGFRRHSGHGRA